MLHDLFPAPAHSRQRFHLPLRGAQQFRGEVSECLDLRCPFRRSDLAQRANCGIMGDIHLHQQQRLGLILRLHAFDEGQRGIIPALIIGPD
ncbi:hypothetical protein A9995_10885 [Erythrobacter sp. QSSC1-22B]|nr:hypothetical protein A9995_10885 [Erythrobacter sp. QSSC1-22B]